MAAAVDRAVFEAYWDDQGKARLVGAEGLGGCSGFAK